VGGAEKKMKNGGEREAAIKKKRATPDGRRGFWSNLLGEKRSDMEKRKGKKGRLKRGERGGDRRLYQGSY